MDRKIENNIWVSSNGYLYGGVCKYSDRLYYNDVPVENVILNRYYPRDNWEKLNVVHLNGIIWDNRLENLDWEYVRPARKIIQTIWENKMSWNIATLMYYFNLSKLSIKEIYGRTWYKDITGNSNEIDKMPDFVKTRKNLDIEYQLSKDKYLLRKIKRDREKYTYKEICKKYNVNYHFVVEACK